MARSEALGIVHEVDLPAGRICYRERGEGPPVVYVHGLLVNADLWRKVVPDVAAAGYRLERRVVVLGLGVAVVVIGSPYLQKLIGKRGMAALEQVMGMVLGLMSMQMIVDGAYLFIKTLK